MTSARKRSRVAKHADPAPHDRSRLVQTRISATADDLIRARAEAQALTVAAYVRRVLYRDVGLIQKEPSDAT
jgi:hypothetical protein